MTNIAHTSSPPDQFTVPRRSSDEFLDPSNCRACKRPDCICVVYNGSESLDDGSCEAQDHPAVLVEFWTESQTVATCRCKKAIYV